MFKSFDDESNVEFWDDPMSASKKKIVDLDQETYLELIVL